MLDTADETRGTMDGDIANGSGDPGEDEELIGGHNTNGSGERGVAAVTKILMWSQGGRGLRRSWCEGRKKGGAHKAEGVEG